MMDTLRYWVTEMHVDGFRFDLAAALAREPHGVRSARRVLRHRCARTRCSSQVKLIAEPWDLGDGGYQVGNFPPGWAEWNDTYRDTVRAYWKGDGGLIGELAQPAVRLERPLRASGRGPDGEHQLRHRARRLHAARPRQLQRQAQRGQRRGQPRRRTQQPQLELRRRRPDRRSGDPRAARSARSAISSRRCCFSQGVPMLLAGDEIGRTQRGNNNAYCQDNEISWLDWNLDDDAQSAARVHAPA